MDSYDRTDAASCKEGGNACMSVGDYVNAMKWYSQALAAAPRDAVLYSNRSFTFLKRGLTARALADAVCALATLHCAPPCTSNPAASQRAGSSFCWSGVNTRGRAIHTRRTSRRRE